MLFRVIYSLRLLYYAITTTRTGIICTGTTNLIPVVVLLIRIRRHDVRRSLYVLRLRSLIYFISFDERRNYDTKRQKVLNSNLQGYHKWRLVQKAENL